MYIIYIHKNCAGFNYKKPLRAPWDMILKQLTNPEFFGDLPCVSVDVPLGWNVNKGPVIYMYIDCIYICIYICIYTHINITMYIYVTYAYIYIYI